MESSNSLYLTICVITAFLALSLGIFLFFIKGKENKANLYLALLVWSYSLFFLPGFFDALGVLDKFSFVIRLNFLTGAIVGPLTYLYCKSSVNRNTYSFKQIYYHFIPFILSIFAFIPTFLKSTEEKLAIYKTTITQGQVPESKVILFLMAIYTMTYTIISIRMTFKYLKHLKNTSSSIDSSFHRWLLFMSCSMTLPIFTTWLVLVTKTAILPINAALLSLSSFVVIIYITFTLKPKFFHHFPHQIKEADPKSKSDSTKYSKSNLQENQKAKYEQIILAFVKENKPYLDPELTINQFSEQIDIPSHYLSQIINQRLKCNFLDFVNQYRIKEAKIKLRDEKLSHFTIMTIAYESGFNSKTAFYSAFKKNVGSTPSQYRKKGEMVLS